MKPCVFTSNCKESLLKTQTVNTVNSSCVSSLQNPCIELHGAEGFFFENLEARDRDAPVGDRRETYRLKKINKSAKRKFEVNRR